jgi:hypothetical protein
MKRQAPAYRAAQLLFAVALVVLGVVVEVTVLAPAATTLELFVEPAGAHSSCSRAAPCGLQAALDEAASTHPDAPVRILLARGTYSGPFSWNDGSLGPSGLTIVGPATPRGATLTGAAAGSVLTVDAPVGSTELTGVTLTGGASVDGGAIDEVAGDLRLENATLFANRATSSGGAVYIGAGTALIEGSTIAANDAARGAAISAASAASVTLHASVLGANGAAPACSTDAITDDGYDVTDDPSCLGRRPAATSTARAPSTALFGARPALLPSGQPGAVVPLRFGPSDPAFDDVPGSVAALAASAPFCALPDERGEQRLQAGASRCSSGSMQDAPGVVTSVTPTSGEPGTTVTVTGSGFRLATAVRLGRTTVAARFAGDHRLTFSVPGSAPSGLAALSVTTLDGTGTLRKAFEVIPALAAPSGSLPSAEVGVPYKATLAASGGAPPYGWSAAFGELPPGLSLSRDGVLSGTPADAGVAALALEVGDSRHAAVAGAVSLLVLRPPAVATTGLPGGEIDKPYSVNLGADGGTPPYAWSIADGGVPPGLLLSSDGTLSGLPGQAGVNELDVRVTDARGASATESLSFSVLGPPPAPQRYAVLSDSGQLSVSSGDGGRVPARRRDPAVAVAAAPRGWWVVSRSGRVIGVDGARSLGSLRAGAGRGAVVAIAAVRGGYYLATSEGTVVGFGRAHAEGSLHLAGTDRRVVGIAAPERGGGYWLLESDGAVVGFGSAGEGSGPPQHRLGRYVGIAADPDGDGYWIATGIGTVLAHGAAEGEGSLPRSAGAGRVTAIAAAPDGAGYWLATSSGKVFAFGSARLPLQPQVNGPPSGPSAASGPSPAQPSGSSDSGIFAAAAVGAVAIAAAS